MFMVATATLSLVLPTSLPHSTVCISIIHTLSLIGTSVQVAVVCVVLVGQLPQSDASILYRIKEQSRKTGLQVNVSSLKPKLATLMCKLFGGGKGPAAVNLY